MRVLGVDPGLTRCGVAVVDGAPGRALTAFHIGVISTSAALDVPQRLAAVEAGLEVLIAEHDPEVIAVERVFSQHNVSTVMGTAQASAVAMLLAARHGLPLALHTPTEVKAAVTGSGRADKAQVSAMVVRLLGLAQAPKPADAADAAAIAICQVWRGAGLARIAQAKAKQAAQQAMARS